MDADSVTRDDVIRMVQSLMTLHADLAGFYNTSGPRPAPNSQADIELHTFSRAESVETAYSQGEVLIEAAADNLAAFTKTVTEPVQTIAPWICVRALMEASALASWFLDPRIDARTRVERSLAFRHEGFPSVSQ
jgi:hypothetical protein